MSNIFTEKTTIVQESGANLYSNIPAVVRSILKPKKGSVIKWIIYDDRTIGIEMVKE